MSDKPVPPAGENLENPVQRQVQEPQRADSPPPQDASSANPAGNPADAANSLDPSSAMSGMDGMSPDSFLGPIQQIGSQIGQLPQQLQQAMGPAMSGLQQPLSMLQGLGSQAGGLPNSVAPKLPQTGAPGGQGGDKTKLDPDQAHETTSKAEGEVAQHSAAAAPQALAGHTPVDMTTTLIGNTHSSVRTGIRGHLVSKSGADAGSRRSGISMIEGADTAGASQQTGVQGRLI